MDNTIIEMFKEKNDKILIEKLLLDVENNNDSLRLTINNKVELVVSGKFLKKINKVLKNSEIEYDIKTLNEIVDAIKKSVKDKLEGFLDDRKKYIKGEISNNFNGIDSLNDVIDKYEENSSQIIEAFVNKLVYDELENKIFDLYKFKSEEQKEEVSSILKRFDSELTSNILIPLKERNSSLKNIMKETQDKVTELNTKTTEMTVQINENKIMKKAV